MPDVVEKPGIGIKSGGNPFLVLVGLLLIAIGLVLILTSNFLLGVILTVTGLVVLVF